MDTFICNVPCWHGGHKFRKGDTFRGNAADLPQDKDGNLRHFVQSGSDKPPEPAKPLNEPDVRVNEQSVHEPQELVKKK